MKSNAIAQKLLGQPATAGLALRWVQGAYKKKCKDGKVELRILIKVL